MLVPPTPSQEDRLRVLIFTNSFRLGGSERQAVELVRHLDRSRFELTLACFRDEGALAQDLPTDIRHRWAFPLRAFWKPGTLRQAVRFLSLLRERRIQVVQCFDFYSNVFAIPLAQLAGAPIVIGCRRHEGTVRTLAQRRVELWSYRYADAIVANGERIQQQLIRRDGVRPDRVAVIYNGIDMARFDGVTAPSPALTSADERGPRIAVLANLRPEKGHFVFLAAAERVSQRFPEARFVIAGDGPEHERIAARIAGTLIAPRVRMIGAVHDVPGFLRSVDVVAVPSVTNEGFPNAAMEAMAAAKPVVATDTGSTGELIVDGVTGYLVRPGDAVQLADRLTDLCAAPSTRRAMGQRGRERVAAGFTAQRMADSFGALFETLLRRGARNRGRRS